MNLAENTKPKLTRVYIVKVDKLKYSHIFFLYPNLGYIHKSTLLFINEAAKQIKPIFEIIDTPEKADFILAPYNYLHFKDNISYIDALIKISKTYNKKILIFDLSDYDYVIDIPNSIVLRTSQYAYKKKKNEYIIPPIVEDLSVGREIVWRRKSNKSTVGFAGWADFPNIRSKFKYKFKNSIWGVRSLWNPHAKVHTQGIYFRRKSIEVLRKSSLVETKFILRKSYSAHVTTIEMNAEKARKEYVQNIIDSDFVLAPKGDGNYSARFYEILSLGRIPVLIDTETVLPSEDIIKYKEFILRVPYQEIDRIDLYIADMYANLTNEQFIDMQQKARHAYTTQLCSDVFLRNFLNVENLSKNII